MNRYYVISPNVDGKGNVNDFLPQMCAEHTIMMGWDPEEKGGIIFSNMKKGDYVICAQGANSNKRTFFAGKVDSDVFGEGPFQRRLSGFVTFEGKEKLFSEDNAFGSSNRIPAIYELKPQTNNSDKIICEYINKIVEGKIIMEQTLATINIIVSNHNLILTGAPGTGKTYLAKQIAAQMILGKEYNEETASDKEKNDMKEQCGFVQFHPSYDYTDFVEGLRPINDKNGNVGFERRDGAFKSFCKDAIKITQSNALKMLEWCKNNFPNQPLNSIGSNKEISFELKDGHIYAIASSGNKYPVNDDRIILYLQTREYDPQHETYVPTVGKYILDNYPDDIEKPPYIFIIDEINRGEISKIFGELFFSIDPGYRGTAGRVKTQYQNLVKKDDVFYNGFYVPENVYIIGTMNDIDRSVESMDFAFRRRFAFKEVTAEESQQMLDSDSAWGKDEKGNSRKPSSEVISVIKERMHNLNEAICPDNNDPNKKGIEGLSSAYHIGASYFLKLANYKNGEDSYDYEKLWDYHLKGLLFEYLRGMPDAEDKLDALGEAFGIKKSDSIPS